MNETPETGVRGEYAAFDCRHDETKIDAQVSPCRSMLRRVLFVLALVLSLSSLAVLIAVAMFDGRLVTILSRFDGVPLRLALLSLAGTMAIWPLIFMGVVWFTSSRERRQAEALLLLRDNREALRLSRDQLRRVFESLPVPYVLARTDGRVIQTNPQALALFGIDSENVSDINIFDLYDDETFSEELKGYLSDNGRIENFEITMRTVSGRKCWVLFSAARVVMDGEQLLFAAFSDITERKRVEQALQKNEAALRAIMDASPIPVVLSRHTSGIVVYMNQAAAKFFGKPIHELMGIPAATCWESSEQYAALLAELNTCGHVEDREGRMQCSDGRVCWVQVSTTILRLQEDTLIYTAFSDITERKRKESELHRLATTDPLTGAMNRRAFNERCAVEADRAKRGGYPVAMVICDLDHFKVINDTYGHATGDHVLKVFTGIVQEMIRPSDALGRIGGEEFAMVLPGSDIESGKRVAERVRERFAEAKVTDAAGKVVPVTASFGVAPWCDGQPLERALQLADGALYAAKAAGRNRVQVACVLPQSESFRIAPTG
ncbi:MAG: MEKHLA domain-containing protein [Rhodospirillaceae bacterium]|nr:MEKHLA domain-containing protein [Rhodospirillaceae bacterium]